MILHHTEYLLVLGFFLTLMGSVTSATVIELRAIGPAQAPGLLPVTCSSSIDYTFDQNVKGNINSTCTGFASPGTSTIPAGGAAISQFLVQGGAIRWTIENTCDTPKVVGIDGCKLEFNSIAYGCSENGRFYNGSSAYGCIHWYIEVVTLNTTAVTSASDLSVRQTPDQASSSYIFCEFPKPGDYGTTNTTDAFTRGVVDGCYSYGALTVPANGTFGWWVKQQDSSILVFKIHNLNTFASLVGNSSLCTQDVDFLASVCASPSHPATHGHLNQDGIGWDFAVQAPSSSVHIPRDAPVASVTCQPSLHNITVDLVTQDALTACSSASHDVLPASGGQTYFLATSPNGTVIMRFTNEGAVMQAIDGNDCSSGMQALIGACSAGPGLFGRGIVRISGFEVEVWVQKSN